MKQGQQREKGFTLIEILIAVAIASLILTIIYGSYASSIDTMNYTRKKLETFSMIRLTLNRMNDELTSAFISSDGYLKFVGEEGKVDFISSSHERIFKNSKEYDLVEISYFTGAAEEGASGSESLLARRESLFLWRREDRTPDNDVLEGGEREKLMEGLKGMVFKYYDGKLWLNEWDSQEKKGLPQAVKVILKFPKKELSTIAFIPLGKSEEVKSEKVGK